MIWLLDTKLINVTHFCIYDQINDYRKQAVQMAIYLKYLRIIFILYFSLYILVNTCYFFLFVFYKKL